MDAHVPGSCMHAFCCFLSYQSSKQLMYASLQQMFFYSCYKYNHVDIQAQQIIIIIVHVKKHSYSVNLLLVY